MAATFCFAHDNNKLELLLLLAPNLMLVSTDEFALKRMLDDLVWLATVSARVFGRRMVNNTDWVSMHTIINSNWLNTKQSCQQS